MSQPTTLNTSPDPLDHVVGLFTDARKKEHNRGYQDALRFAPSLTWDELQTIAHRNFDITNWLTGWKNGWLDIEMGKAPPGASVAPWLPILANYLGNMVDPIGYDRWSFTPNDEYVDGFSAALRDVWDKANRRHPDNDPQQSRS